MKELTQTSQTTRCQNRRMSHTYYVIQLHKVENYEKKTSKLNIKSLMLWFPSLFRSKSMNNKSMLYLEIT